jgi:AcrR family transcriptional regulator
MGTRTSESKQKILLTAIDLIKEKGYDSMTLKDICTEANVSKNTFYYYFKSKEDLLLQFYGIPVENVMSNIASILMEENNVEQFWKLIEPLLDFLVENGTEITKHMLYALTNQHIQPFDISGFQQDGADIVVKIIERAQSSGEIRNSSDPSLLLKTSQAQFLGIVLVWCAKNGEFDFKNEVRLLIEVCFDLKPELRKATLVVFNEV